MSRKDVLLVLGALVAGLVRGMGASWALVPRLMAIQKPPEQGKVVRAESFVVVDTEGKIRAGLGMRTSPISTLGCNSATDSLGWLLGEVVLYLCDGDGKPRAIL